MAWLILPIVLLIVIFVGVRTIRGGWKTPSPARDQAAIKHWAKARERGFFIHCLVQAFPLVAGYCVLGPLVRSWWQTGQISYQGGLGLQHIIFTVFVTLVGGLASWGMLSSAAHEAETRLKQRNTTAPNAPARPTPAA